MEREAILSVLMKLLVDLQVASGLPAPDVSEGTKPLALEEFDSLKCIEFEVAASELLGMEVKDVLIGDDGTPAERSLAEIVDLILGSEHTPVSSDE